MATIKDVARIAGVSVSTVSHVVNGTRYVSPEKVRKVEDAIRQLDELPNFIAKRSALKSKLSESRYVLILLSKKRSLFQNQVKEKLEEIVSAMEKTAAEAGVHIVSGDTKVAGKGQVDGVFITTTGMGQIEDGVNVGGTLAQPGDAIIVTGDVGRHGCTILLAREDFGIEANVTSDCAPLWKTVEAVMNTTHDLHVIRDATRGGVGTVLYEIAGQSNVGIRLDAASVPVAPEVKGVCGMLGLEPLYLACEGRMVIMAPKAEAEKIVETLRKCPYSKDAAIIGEVIDDQPGKVVMTTEIGTQALLPQPGGELLPRIC